MKEIEDFKMLRKGDKIRKYLDSSKISYRDYTVKIGGKAEGGRLICAISNSVPEWLNIYDVVKLKDC